MTILVHYYPCNVLGGWDQALADTVDPDEYGDEQSRSVDFDEWDDEIRRYNRAQKRIPAGNVGGGRWRDIHTIIIGLLKDWAKGEGPDDPLKDFDRDQLRRYAKESNIPLRRGAQDNEIKNAILDSVRHQGVKEPPAPVKAVKKAAPASRTAPRVASARKASSTPDPDAFDRKAAHAAHGSQALASAPTLVTYDEDADGWTAPGLPERDRTRVAKAVATYWAHGQDINEYLRDGPEAYGPGGRKKMTAPAVRRTVTDVDRLYDSSHLSRDAVVWRGFGGRSVFGDDPDAWPDDLSGHEWVDPGYVSTAAQRDEASHFVLGGSAGPTDRRGVMARILLPEGAPVLSLSEMEATELLLSRGWTFRVVRDHGWIDDARPSGVRKHRLLDVEATPPRAPSASKAAARPQISVRDVGGKQRYEIHEGGRVVGHAEVGPTVYGKPGSRKLFDLKVDPDARGSGHGKALMDRVTADADQDRVDVLLWPVPEGRPAGGQERLEAFYRGYGFHDAPGDQPYMVREPKGATKKAAPSASKAVKAAPAKKAPRPATSETVAKLRAAKSRDEAEAALSDLSADELKQVAQGMNMPLVSRDKAGIRRDLVQTAVGNRLDSTAIRELSTFDRERQSRGDVPDGLDDLPDYRLFVLATSYGVSNPHDKSRAQLIAALRRKGVANTPDGITVAARPARKASAASPTKKAPAARLTPEELLQASESRVYRHGTDLDAITAELELMPTDQLRALTKQIYGHYTPAGLGRRPRGEIIKPLAWDIAGFNRRQGGYEHGYKSPHAPGSAVHFRGEEIHPAVARPAASPVGAGPAKVAGPSVAKKTAPALGPPVAGASLTGRSIDDLRAIASAEGIAIPPGLTLTEIRKLISEHRKAMRGR